MDFVDFDAGVLRDAPKMPANNVRVGKAVSRAHPKARNRSARARRSAQRLPSGRRENTRPAFLQQCLLGFCNTHGNQCEIHSSAAC